VRNTNDLRIGKRKNASLVRRSHELLVRKREFHSHVQPVVRLIRNRDTTVIIRLNNSLSPDLSKNVPMVPYFLLSSSIAVVSTDFFPFLAWRMNYTIHENSENYCFLSVSSKAPKYKKLKPIGSIQSARNKGCRITVTERPSFRHCFLRIARQVVYLFTLRIFLIFNVYSWSFLWYQSPLRLFYKSITH
jgi:hypothetical protein